jgi:ABC-2 type transport system ATP-binding protein
VPVEPSITVSQLGARYGRRAVLTDVSFELAAGFVALVGANGSGKSTLLRLLATLVPISAGSATVAGHSLGRSWGAEHARRELGYLPQEPHDLAHLTVVEACRYAAWLKGVPRRRRRGAVEEVIERLALGEVRRQKLAELSGGTRRRAYLAQAVVHSPSVVLLDEPTAGLDADHRQQVWESLHTASASSLVFYSTHIAEDIRRHADRVISLRDSRLSFDGTPAELLEVTRSRVAESSELDNALRAIGEV